MPGVFEALGDPVRRQLLRLLADGGEQPVVDLVRSLQSRRAITQPAVSQHLKVLRDAGLVTARADGSRRLHAVDPRGVEAAQAWLATLADPLGGLAQPLDALATEVARGRRERRSGGGAAGAHGGARRDLPA